MCRIDGISLFQQGSRSFSGQSQPKALDQSRERGVLLPTTGA
jgi:hypothetical protein